MGCLRLQYETNLTLHIGAKTKVGNSQNPSRLPQKSRVETGYYYYGARYYDPKVSNWLSVDPIALYDPIQEDEHYIDGEHNGGVFNPMNLNVYGYCYQNPIRFVDPNGKQVDKVLSYTDVDDVAVAVTYVNRNLLGNTEYGDSAVHVDGEQATGSDAIFIAGGILLPVVSSKILKEGVEKIGEVGKKTYEKLFNNSKKVYTPKDADGKPLKIQKSPAGNTKIDKEAKGKAHTQLRKDKSGNYAQRTTFDGKGRKRSDTHYTTHGEKNKSNPHKHTYYKNGARSKNK